MSVAHYSTGFVEKVGRATSGASYANCLTDGIIRYFGGTMPANADLTEGSAYLAQLTLSSGAFTPGVGTNGLELDTAPNGVVTKKSGEVWSGVGTADAGTGTIVTWARYYDNAVTTGASTSSVRIDIDVATSGAYIILGNTNIVESATTTLDNFTLTIPKTA